MLLELGPVRVSLGPFLGAPALLGPVQLVPGTSKVITRFVRGVFCYHHILRVEAIIAYGLLRIVSTCDQSQGTTISLGREGTNPKISTPLLRSTLFDLPKRLCSSQKAPSLIRVNLPSYALQPRNDTAVGAHCGRADQGPEMDPRSRSRLVERTAVGEGG